MRNYVEFFGFRNVDVLRGYKVLRIGLNGFDFFCEDRNSVWFDEERYEDDDNDDEQGLLEDSENSVSYELWGEEFVSSIVSESVGFMFGFIVDFFVIGVKKFVYQVWCVFLVLLVVQLGVI